MKKIDLERKLALANEGIEPKQVYKGLFKQVEEKKNKIIPQVLNQQEATSNYNPFQGSSNNILKVSQGQTGTQVENHFTPFKLPSLQKEIQGQEKTVISNQDFLQMNPQNTNMMYRGAQVQGKSLNTQSTSIISQKTIQPYFVMQQPSYIRSSPMPMMHPVPVGA